MCKIPIHLCLPDTRPNQLCLEWLEVAEVLEYKGLTRQFLH